MNLKAIKFCRFQGEINEWSIEGKLINGVDNQWVTFENINLIVGKNATGKSRMVDVLRRIADLVSGEIKITDLEYSSAIFELNFENNKEKLCYFLEFKDNKVIQEKLSIDNNPKLDREQSFLFYENEHKSISFQMADDLLAVTRRDSLQQPFFELLAEWGKNLSHYRFGTHLGRESLFSGNIDIDLIKKQDISLKTNNKVLITFLKGIEIPNFENIIISDMKEIGYNITNITYGKQVISALGIDVQETDMEAKTHQIEMSQGMFRALSLLIQLNYSLLSKIPSCILIDDIGEGLDYDRSKSLIDLVIKKVENSSVQVIMTTNDRFVMNKIPLQYWSVIHRVPKKSLFYNYKNSKDVFDEFKYTGLSNFDFLSSEFYIEGFETQEQL